jgi:hypothetical protein
MNAPTTAMRTRENFISNNNNGYMADLIARAGNGTPHCHYPRKDSDFTVEFSDEKRVLTIKQIKALLQQEYGHNQGLGIKFNEYSPPYMLTGEISIDNILGDPLFLLFEITTPFSPSPDAEEKYVWVTTQLL